MRLAWAALALEARTNERERTLDVAGLGIDTFWVAELPEPIEFYLLLYFKGSQEEFERGDSYPVEIALARPGAAIGDLSFEYVPSGVPENHEEGWEVNEIYSAGVTETFDRLGGFCVDIWFEQQRYKDSPYFIVRQGIPPR